MKKENNDKLTSINRKLIVLLAFLLRDKGNAIAGDDKRQRQRTLVGFLSECGLNNAEIALILGITKDSTRMMKLRYNRGRETKAKSRK